MNFTTPGSYWQAGASLGELPAAQQAFGGADQIALHDTGEVASRILPPLHAPGAMWLSTQGNPGTMLDAPLRRFLFTRMPTLTKEGPQKSTRAPS